MEGMEAYEPNSDRKAWLRYLAAEREALLLRASGLLSHVFASVRSGESREELDRIAQEDERLAQEGLLRLLGEDGYVCLKHVDDLTPEDVPARRRAEVQLLDFLRERTRGHLERSGRHLFRSPLRD